MHTLQILELIDPFHLLFIPNMVGFFFVRVISVNNKLLNRFILFHSNILL